MKFSLPRIAAARTQVERERDVRHYFDRQFESYSNFFLPQTATGTALLFRQRLALSVEMLRGSGGALLDCASGPGEITRAIIAASQFDFVTINDISPFMIERCRETLSDLMPETRVTWSVHSVFELPPKLRPSKFDVVLCLGLIAHCGNLPTLMRKLALILKPGGVMLLQSSLLDNLGERIVKLVAKSSFRRTSYLPEGYYLKDIIDAASASDFQLIETRRFGLCLPFGDRLLGPVNYWLEKKLASWCLRNGGEALFLFRKSV